MQRFVEVFSCPKDRNADAADERGFFLLQKYGYRSKSFSIIMRLFLPKIPALCLRSKHWSVVIRTTRVIRVPIPASY
jgi:hypothetical protein